jgi:hypothetical protein
MSFTLDNDQIEFEVQTPLTPGTAAAEAQDEALPADYEYFYFRSYAFLFLLAATMFEFEFKMID